MKDLLGKYLMHFRIKTVLPHISGKLLDLGCGTNKLVAQYNRDGIGVDVYQWGGVDLLIEDSSKLPFSDGTFDTVTIIAALNHIPNRKEALQDVYRVLKKDGRIIITMIPPAISRIWHAMRRPWDADQKRRGMRDGEVYGMTSKEVVLLCAQAGFTLCLKKKFMLGINSMYIFKKNG
jgi:SAM-dependent methyltransferase